MADTSREQSPRTTLKDLEAESVDAREQRLTEEEAETVQGGRLAAEGGGVDGAESAAGWPKETGVIVWYA